MKEPVDHILRPCLPWRSDSITECGHDPAHVQVITRTEYIQRYKDLGQKRTALLTCMTCADTATRYGTWDDDPRRAFGREVDWECRYRNSDEHGVRLRDELLAIAALIEAHRQEFDALVFAHEQRRSWLERKAESEAQRKRATKKEPPRGGL